MQRLEALKTHLIIECDKALDQSGLAPETYAALHILQDLIENLKKELKETAISEIEKYGKEGVTKLGLKMTAKYGAGRYDYSVVPEWVELDRRKKEVEKNAALAARGGNQGIIDKEGSITPPAVYMSGPLTVYCEKLKS